MNSGRRLLTHLLAALSLALALTGCEGLLPTLLGEGGSVDEARIAVGVTDIDGLARVQTDLGVMDFEVTSGLTGERQIGIRLRVASFGDSRMLLAEDPAGEHLPVAVPLAGDATVRRLVMPPLTGTNTNITTAIGPLILDEYEYVGRLEEGEIRSRLLAGPDEAVLLYLYNVDRPLAVTGAPLEAYSTPFDNVTILKAAGEPEDAQLAMVVAALDFAGYQDWSNRNIDRYLSGRIGQQPDVDLRADLDSNWAYPVFDVFPPGADIELGASEEEALLRVNWRSQNPDPPPPWRFFVTSNDPHVVVEPEAFALGPDSPPAEVTLTLDRSDLAEGEYEATIFFQPFSDAFGMIEQGVEKTVMWEVADALPTATPAASATDVSIDPPQPREGDALIVTATGFDGTENVLVEFLGQDTQIRDALPTADPTGAFRYQLDLTRVEAGEYTLRLTGAESGTVAEIEVVVQQRIADAVVSSQELNLRLGPGYDNPVTEVLVRGDELTAISTNWNNEWMEVETASGQQGWVLVELLDLNVDLADVPFHDFYGIRPEER